MEEQDQAAKEIELKYIYTESLRLLEILVFPKEFEKKCTFLPRELPLSKFQIRNLKSPLLKKLSVPLLPHFV